MTAALALRTVRQLEIADCGAACLATVLRAYGDPVTLSELRDLSSTGRDGVSALGLIAAAEARGFSAEGIGFESADLPDLPAGTILHWGSNHFVVLGQPSRRGARVLDPALGPRTVPADELAALASGVGIVIGSQTPPRPAARTPLRDRYLPYLPFLVGARPPLLLSLLWAALAQGLALAYPFLLQHVVDDSGRGITHSTLTLTLLALGAAGAFALAQLGRLGAALALEQAVDVRLSTGVLSHLVSLPWEFLSRRASGDLVLRLRSTVAVRQILTTTALTGTLDGILVLLYLGLVARIDLLFALLTLLVVVAQVITVRLAWPALRNKAARTLEAQTTAQDELYEIVDGLQVLKASGAADRTARGWETSLAREVLAAISSARLSGRVEAALSALRFLLPLLLLSLGLRRVHDGSLGLGEMLAAVALAAAITVPTSALLTTVCSLSTVAEYLYRLDDLLLAAPERRGGVTVSARGPLAVTLEDVSFRYSALLEPALRDVTLHIAPGEHVAVVGASGSGKSTLAMLVATLNPPSSGTVRVGGISSTEVDLEQLRSRLGVVPQAPSLFSATIRDNIAFGRSLTPRQITAAARKAAIHADIAALPSGYESRLGNGGSGMSGGQQQRIALARALAGTPGLLVLDEATSALDATTEREVHEALALLRCTRLVIAHRVTTLQRADRIVVLDRGRVVAQGTYASLSRREPHFRALLKSSQDE